MVSTNTCALRDDGKPDWTSESSAAAGLQTQQMNENVPVQLVSGSTSDLSLQVSIAYINIGG